MSALDNTLGPDPAEDACVDCNCRPKHRDYDICFECLKDYRQQDKFEREHEER